MLHSAAANPICAFRAGKQTFLLFQQQQAAAAIVWSLEDPARGKS